MPQSDEPAFNAEKAADALWKVLGPKQKEEAAKKKRKRMAPYAETSAEESTVTPMTVPSFTIHDSDGNVVGWSLADIATTSSTNHLTLAVAEAEVESEAEIAPVWEGVLAVEGLETSDKRYLMPGKIEWRELPLTLMAQTVTAEGHDGAFTAGKITKIWREDRPDLGKDAVAIMGSGVFANDAEGQRAHALLEEEVLRGVSIDFAPTARKMLDPETHEVINEEELGIAELLAGDFVMGLEGNIMGATMCPFQAFEDATMQIVEAADKVVVASAFPVRKVLTASAAGIAPLAPPYEWFFKEETLRPCPLTVTPEGQVYGHLALWNQCHRSFDSCEMAPRSRSGYAFFHTGAITCDDGRVVNVGRITVGDGGHASTSPVLGTQGAIDHYDRTGLVGAFVRAVDGLHGIWLSGSIRSDCPAEKVRDMQANPPSGDWREEKGRLELCAALSVPVAGFPVPRYEAALVASGSDEHVVSLIAMGYSEETPLTRRDQRKFSRLMDSAKLLLASAGARDFELESEEFADITADQRKKWAKSGVALPDGSFPIPDCSYAEKAIRAQGRANPGDRGRVKSHISKRVRALGCSGGIFDNYK